MSVLSADSRRDFEIRHYPVLVYALSLLVSLVLQAWLPRVVGRFVWFDLPLVVTIYFSLSRRNPIQGALLGTLMGLFEDALTHHPVGINGICKTVAGYLAASVGMRVDVENHTVRVLVVFVLSALCSGLYIFVYRFLLGMALEANWLTELYKAVGNSLIALVLFPVIDGFKIRE